MPLPLSLCARGTQEFTSIFFSFWHKPNLRALFWRQKGVISQKHDHPFCLMADVWKICDNALMIMWYILFMSQCVIICIKQFASTFMLAQAKSEGPSLKVKEWEKVGKCSSIVPQIIQTLIRDVKTDMTIILWHCVTCYPCQYAPEVPSNSLPPLSFILA